MANKQKKIIKTVAGVKVSLRTKLLIFLVMILGVGAWFYAFLFSYKQLNTTNRNYNTNYNRNYNENYNSNYNTNRNYNSYNPIDDIGNNNYNR